MLLAILAVIGDLGFILEAPEKFDSWDIASKEDWSMAAMLDRRNSGIPLFCTSMYFLCSIWAIIIVLYPLRLTWKRHYYKAKVMSMCVMARLIILPSVLSIYLLGVKILKDGKLPSLGDNTFGLAFGLLLRIIISEEMLPELAYTFQTLVGLFPLLLAWSRPY